MAGSSSITSDYRLALALALVKSRSAQGSALQHWKKKAKSRKKELETLQKMLQQQQCDLVVSGVLPLPGSCKCSFFQSSDKGFEISLKDVQANDLDQLLFRQFLRNVNRWNYANDSQTNKWFTGASDMDRENQLSITCRFLAELVRKKNPDADNGGYLAVYAHQAVDFLQGILGQMLKNNKHDKVAMEGIIADLASQLIKMMLTHSCNMESDLKESSTDARSWIFQLLSKLGAFCFVGQRILVMATDQFAAVSERLCFVDPFDKNVCQVYNNVMFMLQLIENLVLYHSSCWKDDEYFDEGLLEEWIPVFVKLRKTCAVLGKCNSLFLAYMERITSQMVKQLHRLSNVEGNRGKNLNAACFPDCCPQVEQTQKQEQTKTASSTGGGAALLWHRTEEEDMAACQTKAKELNPV
ncbi:hypothetical protein GOP47_0013436 [Adiantum capillus-veneris]|uniref:Uncharacterized protein n=1 Tax=Adiantum capillus-veneris TaxID=13818 RepID=A0A9D4ZFA8_ADICA|nr:hypothetical protein GOP47_0013436 [Adiantum capillus-veneris]